MLRPCLIGAASGEGRYGPDRWRFRGLAGIARGKLHRFRQPAGAVAPPPPIAIALYALWTQI
jgi:hypothetical protein